ncbi:MAG: membrane protein insertase YidC [Candidatus Aminicenantes bacterium]|nr:membrane protein insertase YidC [Candidatus Aminicenantes bacterium]
MEKRLLLAIFLSFLVLFLYQVLFVKHEPLPESSEEIVSALEREFQKQEPTQEPSLESHLKEDDFQSISTQLKEDVFIETPLYKAIWSNEGAVLKSWKLKQHKGDNGEDLEIVSFASTELNKYPFSIATDDPYFDKLANTSLYQVSAYRLELKEGQTGELRFQFASKNGTKIEKIFVFNGETYNFDIQINVWKNGQKIEPYLLWGPSLGNLSQTEQKQRFGGGQGISVLAGKKVFRQSENKFKPEQSAFNFVKWAAYEDNYFTALFLTSPEKSSAVFIREEINQTPCFFLSVNFPQKVYIGPKDLDGLTQFGSDAKKLIRFGFFGWIAEILLRSIKSIHKITPNWGFSIIILTFIIKIIFFPLTYSSTRSMAKMQELQPKIKAIRAKYKKAKKDIAQRRKMNEEIMALYKGQGINPAGGCLPLLIQIPIFWGFFRMLAISIEFRHSPFLFWIKDLSVKDPFYITPVLMGITQFISQKMTPTSADPAQQKMMLIMPVVMTIFFMNFQSGLILYWLTNNVLQVGQQYIMNHLAHKKKREAHAKRRKK